VATPTELASLMCEHCGASLDETNGYTKAQEAAQWIQ